MVKERGRREGCKEGREGGREGQTDGLTEEANDEKARRSIREECGRGREKWLTERRVDIIKEEVKPIQVVGRDIDEEQRVKKVLV